MKMQGALSKRQGKSNVKGIFPGWNSVPSNHVHLELVSVTVFRNREDNFFRCNQLRMRSHWIRVLQSQWPVFLEGKRFKNTHTNRERRWSRGDEVRDWTNKDRLPRNGRDCWQPPETKRGKGWLFLRAFEENMIRPTPWFLDFSPPEL